MTREQAIDILDRSTSVGDRISAAYWIDIFVALGMLKLDEPKPAFAEKLEKLGFRTDLDECLRRGGLKIVEK